MHRIYLITSILTAVLLSSCCRQSVGNKEGGDTVVFKYASLLTVTKYDGYMIATIRNPWKTDKLLHTYVLVPDNKPLPEGLQLPTGSIIRTPVKRAAVFTTVHCSLLTRLGIGDRIVAVADLPYIKIPYIQKQVKANQIADCGNGLSPAVETIMDIRPEIIMLSPFENSGGYGKIEDLDIPLVECAEYMESSPLARAEWMRFYGMLYGKEQQADSLFAVVDSCYQALKRSVRQASKGCSLLMDKMVGSVWYVPGGQSTIGQMIKDAGGHYPWADDTRSGSLSLPFEMVLERAGECDVWLFRYSSNHQMNSRELLSEHPGYRQLKAFRTHRVYGCNVEQSLFYEETPFRPDYLLSDFIQIIHPEIGGLSPLRYFQLLP